MLLSPKKTKFKKFKKSRIGGISATGNTLHNGCYGLSVGKACRLSAKQIEAARKTIKRRLKRTGILWIRTYPDMPVTAKPAEVRMGKGKGAFSYWGCNVSAGKILFELDGVTMQLAKEAFTLAASKLPVNVLFIKK
jgi:large subunit ribosomal protein L16